MAINNTFSTFILLLIIMFNLSSPSSTSPEALKATADIVVAQDGTGDYKTIKEAIAASPDNSKGRFTIYIKRGIYDEVVRISGKKTNLTLIGDGKDSTIITGNRSADSVLKTFCTATLAVDGEGFMAQDLRIQNTAGPLKHQAVALRVTGDRAVIYRCHIDAYQDTLYAHKNHQFYRECHITGTIDFICGDAAAVFQYCRIEARKPKEGQSNVVTAQSGEEFSRDFGFSIQKCNITASADLAPVKRSVKTFLGRPWRKYSRVAILESYIDDLIDPLGWTPWDKEFGLSTLTYREYKNYGPGADTRKRINWKGFQVVTDSKKVMDFTVQTLLRGESWISATGVPYDVGL